jgi:hypothetical protein
MKITKKKNRVYATLKDFPSVTELAQLNDFKMGNYYICEDRGYKRLLVQSGEGHRYICMECPINETFQL